MATPEEVHARVSVILEKEGSAAARRDLREMRKELEELEKAADPTTRKLEKLEGMMQRGLLTPEEHAGRVKQIRDAQAAKQAEIDERANQAALESIPGVGPAAAMARRTAMSSMAGVAGGAAIAGGIGAWFIKENIRLLKMIAENTAAATEFSATTSELEETIEALAGAGPFNLEEATALARSLGRAGEPHMLGPGEMADWMLRLLNNMPAETRQDRFAMRQMLQAFGVSPQMMRLRGRTLDFDNITPSEGAMFDRETVNRFQQGRRQVTRSVLSGQSGAPRLDSFSPAGPANIYFRPPPIDQQSMPVTVEGGSDGVAPSQ